MRKHVAAWPERTWAVEGSNGAGRPAGATAARGEHVVDVPAKLAARARLFDNGHNRKTDAHAVAVVAVRTEGLQVLAYDVELEALRMLTERREELTRQRVQTVNRLQRLLAELTPEKDQEGHHNPACQDHPGLGATWGPGREDRRRLAVEKPAELVAVEKKVKALTKELKARVIARGSR